MKKQEIIDLLKDYKNPDIKPNVTIGVNGYRYSTNLGLLLELQSCQNDEEVKEIFNLIYLVLGKQALEFIVGDLLSRENLIQLAAKFTIDTIVCKFDDNAAVSKYAPIKALTFFLDETLKMCETRESRNDLLKRVMDNVYRTKLHCMYKNRDTEKYLDCWVELVKDKQEEVNEPLW